MAALTEALLTIFAQPPYALALAGTIFVAGFLVSRLEFPECPFIRFLVQIPFFSGFTAVLIGAGVMPTEPTPTVGLTFAYAAASGFKVIWWLSAAWLIVGFLTAILVFKRQPRETRFLQDIVVGAIYISAGFGIIADVFNIPVTGLLAASGVIAIVLALALQSTLGDVFSGIVLNLAKPYHPGDWVILDGGMLGRVIEINWRATHLLTPDNDVAIIPNSILAKTKLVNASQPASVHGFTITIRLEPASGPSRGCAALQAALLSCDTILRKPAPVVAVQTLDAFAVGYDVQFFVARYEDGPAAQNELFGMVFRHCLSAGLRLAPPASGLAFPSPHSDASPVMDIPRRLLDHLPIFAPLSEEERIALVPKMKRRTHKVGEVLVQQGSVAQELSIVGSGALIAVQKHGGEEVEALRLAPGDSFGEAGVLSGAATMFEIRALTKTTIYAISKGDLAAILTRRPAMVAALGEVLARRMALGLANLEEIADHDKPGDTLAQRLAQRVKDMFGLPEDSRRRVEGSSADPSAPKKADEPGRLSRR